MSSNWVLLTVESVTVPDTVSSVPCRWQPPTEDFQLRRWLMSGSVSGESTLLHCSEKVSFLQPSGVTKLTPPGTWGY